MVHQMQQDKTIAPLERQSAVSASLVEVGRGIREGGNEADLKYFNGHLARYARTLHRVMELCLPGSRVLDIGSHYLHQAAALGVLGYEVVGIDVAAFSEQAPMKVRAARYNISNYSCDRMDLGEFLGGNEEAFDVILFTEILEHITFNPIRFWRRAYDLMKIGSLLYVTTPNCLTAFASISCLEKDSHA
jgi:2-polyprenyl-6-hydroxyphenyl methylase/3-demethylubiquinone-9 3-methyltransferase